MRHLSRSLLKYSAIPAYSNSARLHINNIRAMSSLVQFGQKHVARGVNRHVEATFQSGKGSYVTLDDGREMLDFTCGIGVTSLGVATPPWFSCKLSLTVSL
jgi:4-aminobutyrate aminotransferase-like enzyme